MTHANTVAPAPEFRGSDANLPAEALSTLASASAMTAGVMAILRLQDDDSTDPLYISGLDFILEAYELLDRAWKDLDAGIVTELPHPKREHQPGAPRLLAALHRLGAAESLLAAVNHLITGCKWEVSVPLSQAVTLLHEARCQVIQSRQMLDDGINFALYGLVTVAGKAVRAAA